MRRTIVLVCVSIFVVTLVAGISWAEKRDAITSSKNVADGQDRVVNSYTIFDDGDATADTILFPPGSTTGTWQDHYFLIEGGVVSAATMPFSVEEIQYYLENIWGSHATAALWSAAGLASPYAAGNFSGAAAGWNTLVLATPLQITASGFPQWWMGAWNSYTYATPAPCGSCRQVGVDTGAGLPGVGRGYYSDQETAAGAITNAQPFASTEVPLIRAGITATSNTVPVELMEFSIE